MDSLLSSCLEGLCEQWDMMGTRLLNWFANYYEGGFERNFNYLEIYFYLICYLVGVIEWIFTLNWLISWVIYSKDITSQILLLIMYERDKYLIT